MIDVLGGYGETYGSQGKFARDPLTGALVPVAYTLKKHVRKPRGAAVGAVMMEREEVIMVEPKLPAGSEP